MGFFIEDAMAQTAGSGGGIDLLGLAFPILLLVVFYFLLIRPQQKRAKEHKNMVDGIKKGDEVVTNGGIAGTVTKVGESFFAVQIANNVEVQVQKQSIGNLLPKGSLKKL